MKLLMVAYYTAVDVPYLFLACQLNCELGDLQNLACRIFKLSCTIPFRMLLCSNVTIHFATRDDI